jgi:hypothetical protein
LNTAEFTARLQAPRAGELPVVGKQLLLCGHLEQPSRAQDEPCAFCVDGAEAHALHERLERQEREEKRRRDRYPWIDA